MKWIAVFISAVVAAWLFVAAATVVGILDSYKWLKQNKERTRE